MDIATVKLVKYEMDMTNLGLMQSFVESPEKFSSSPSTIIILL